MKAPSKYVIPNSFSFVINEDNSIVSAGIYNQQNILIRTLWSNVTYNSGTYSSEWDGLDDFGNQQANGEYPVKVLSNNNIIVWEGVIGNSSLNLNGPDVWRGGSTITCMVETGTSIRCGMSFAERDVSQSKFLKSSPQQKIVYSQFPYSSDEGCFYNCANSTYVFWGSRDYSANQNFIFAETLSNELIYSFPDGQTMTPAPPGHTYSGVLDLNNNFTVGQITGLAVQQSGNGYLFSAHKNQNVINVFKTGDGSGQSITSISISNPVCLFLENDNILWIGQGTTITKYNVNSDGSISVTANQISGFANVLAFSIYNGTLWVIDGGNQQIIKLYNTTSLAFVTSYLTLGGYENSPTVSNNKCYFEDIQGARQTFICHQSDGSAWFGDTGNCRNIHIDNSGNYIEQICFIPLYQALISGYNIHQAYAVQVCENQNTQLFNTFLEFTIDYTQPIDSGWTLINNWGYNYPSGWDNTSPITGVALLSNNRRYILLTQGSTIDCYLAELTTNGLRIIYPFLPQLLPLFDKDGNLTSVTTSISGGNVTLEYIKYTLTGFDGSNNPIYSSGVSKTVYLGDLYSRVWSSRYSVTDNGNIIVFGNLPQTTGNSQYHLGGYNILSDEFEYGTWKDDLSLYIGDYPFNHIFDQGNSVRAAGGDFSISDNNIFVNYRGEFWKESEAGYIHHFDDTTGLMLGVFGQSIPFYGLNTFQAQPEIASNSLGVRAAKVNNDVYLYMNDESRHGGVHRWHISNLNSINTQVTNLNYTNSTSNIPISQIDLLANLPRFSSIENQSAIWTQNIPDTNSGNTVFYSLTQQSLYDLNISPDIIFFAKGISESQIFKQSCQLTQGSNFQNWAITGSMDLTNHCFASIEGGLYENFYIDILDANNKTLVRFNTYSTNRVSVNNTYFGPYNQGAFGRSDFVIKKSGNQIYMLINIFGDWISTYQTVYDITADILNPKFMTWNFDLRNGTRGVNESQFGILQLFWNSPI